MNGAMETGARESHVQAELIRLEKELARLEETANMVEQRLGTVILPSAPTSGNEIVKEPPSALVPLGTRIQQARMKVELTVRSLNSLLQRIEL